MAVYVNTWIPVPTIVPFTVYGSMSLLTPTLSNASGLTQEIISPVNAVISAGQLRNFGGVSSEISWNNGIRASFFLYLWSRWHLHVARISCVNMFCNAMFYSFPFNHWKHFSMIQTKYSFLRKLHNVNGQKNRLNLEHVFQSMDCIMKWYRFIIKMYYYLSVPHRNNIQLYCHTYHEQSTPYYGTANHVTYSVRRTPDVEWRCPIVLLSSHGRRTGS